MDYSQFIYFDAQYYFYICMLNNLVHYWYLQFQFSTLGLFYFFYLYIFVTFFFEGDKFGSDYP